MSPYRYRHLGLKTKGGVFKRVLAKLIGAIDEPQQLQAVYPSGSAVIAEQVALTG
jgi:hypothetical protein